MAYQGGSPITRGGAENALVTAPPQVPHEKITEFLNTLKLTNVVATVRFCTGSVDLKEIALAARNAEYNPRRFPAVIMHLKEPKSAALIFASGKMVVTGTRTEADSRRACQKYAAILAKAGKVDVTLTDYTLQNMTGSCDASFPIRLESVVCINQKFCSYEPEIFPGLVFRMFNPKVVFLIFVSGRIIITGAKSEANMREALSRLLPYIYQFRKVVVSTPATRGGGARGAAASGGGGGASSSAASR